MSEKALAYNSSIYAISFGLKMALPAISLNATIDTKAELSHQN